MKSISFWPQQPRHFPTTSRQCSRPCCCIRWVPKHDFLDTPEDCYDATEWFVDNSKARFGAREKNAGGEVIRPVAHSTHRILLTIKSRLAPTSVHTPLSVSCRPAQVLASVVSFPLSELRTCPCPPPYTTSTIRSRCQRRQVCPQYHLRGTPPFFDVPILCQPKTCWRRW